MDLRKDIKRRVDYAIKKHYRRLTRPPRRGTCSNREAEKFIENSGPIFCAHVSAQVTQEGCRQMRAWAVKKREKSADNFDVGYMIQCQNCPHGTKRPTPNIEESRTKLIALALVKEEFEDRKRRGMI